MKLTAVLFFLINTLINCQPIDNLIGKTSSVEHRLTFNFTDSSDNGVIDDVGARISNLSSSERISLPQDVELVEPPRRNQQQSTIPSGIGSLIDLIFAVNSTYRISTFFCL